LRRRRNGEAEASSLVVGARVPRASTSDALLGASRRESCRIVHELLLNARSPQLGLPEGDLTACRLREHAAPSGRVFTRLEKNGRPEAARPRSDRADLV